MKINILTIFPEMFDGWLNTGMIKIAQEKQMVEFKIIDIRNHTKNKHKKVDDYPYGGFEGMLMCVEPLDCAIIENNLEKTHKIFPSPRGKILNQDGLKKLLEYDELTLIAGRYEGVDQRFIDMHVDEEISLGDYIITGGELSIQVILDGVIRLIPDVLGNSLSYENESFSDNLLEQPQYTRPYEYKGLKVPDVLLCGDPKKINKWVYDEKYKITKERRPDLIKGDI